MSAIISVQAGERQILNLECEDEDDVHRTINSLHTYDQLQEYPFTELTVCVQRKHSITVQDDMRHKEETFLAFTCGE